MHESIQFINRKWLFNYQRLAYMIYYCVCLGCMGVPSPWSGIQQHHTHTHTQTHTHTHTNTHTHTYTRLHARTDTHTQTHTRTNTHSHTRTHAHTHSLTLCNGGEGDRLIDRQTRRDRYKSKTDKEDEKMMMMTMSLSFLHLLPPPIPASDLTGWVETNICITWDSRTSVGVKIVSNWF